MLKPNFFSLLSELQLVSFIDHGVRGKCPGEVLHLMSPVVHHHLFSFADIETEVVIPKAPIKPRMTRKNCCSTQRLNAQVQGLATLNSLRAIWAHFPQKTKHNKTFLTSKIKKTRAYISVCIFKPCIKMNLPM